jgi:hypothetical protein
VDLESEPEDREGGAHTFAVSTGTGTSRYE